MPPKPDHRRLPPLNPLKGFEAATRHQSISAAADELCLTHPAVSHQVLLLERALGVALFTRQGRHIVSTEEGRLLYPYVRRALETLIEGADAARRHALDTPLRVQTYVTASIRWLAPRIPAFQAEHRAIRLTLSTCAVDWAFDDTTADVGLVYCETSPDARFLWTPLFDYRLYPVCGPALATRLGPNPQPMDLLGQKLIVIDTESQSWAAWFQSAGVAFDPALPFLSVDTLAVALEMALNNDAIALVNGPFAESDLAAGRLVRPVAHTALCPGAWGLICRADRQDDLRIRAFITWFATQAHHQGPSPRPITKAGDVNLSQ